MGKKRKRSEARLQEEPSLPPKVHHYNKIGQVPWDIQKYWHQRHSIFSLYDSGIWMTDDAWFGVTPEPVAVKIAEHIVAEYLSPPAAPVTSSTSPTTAGATATAVASPSPPKITSPPLSATESTVIIDAFAGAGGNTIAFALHTPFSRVIAIEADEAVLACAKHNAHGVYGVPEDRIGWILGDCFEEVPRLRAALKSEGAEVVVVFASPPWGGVGYRDEEVFDLWGMEPYGLGRLWGGLATGGDEVEEGKEGEGEGDGGLVLYLPRTSDLRQIAGVVGRVGDGKGVAEEGRRDEEGERGREKVKVVHYCVKGASKALCVYFRAEHLREGSRMEDERRGGVKAPKLGWSEGGVQKTRAASAALTRRTVEGSKAKTHIRFDD